MNQMKTIIANAAAALASQQALTQLLPLEYQPVGNAVIAIAAILAGLFQKQPGK